ncbi:MAG: glycosyltransferase family 2 protein [Pirellulales bacterium]|nr:glycosyltransferase family 2 protein [Pirellulales bacterium]
MKIAAVCCTYLRPVELGRMIRCFELQDHAARELIVLDDAGQYDNQRGDRWRLISTGRRFPSLGEKRNAAVALVADDVEALAVWDDDDLYLPWALSASAAALRIAPWSRPSLVLRPQRDGSLRQHATGGLFHGGWAYRREALRQVGGYPAVNNGEDQALAGRLERAGLESADPIAWGGRPFYIYTWGTGWHLSGMGPDGYRRLGDRVCEKARPPIADPPRVDLQRPKILPGIHPRRF